ncbi:MAG: hypothetical protein MZV65_19955 [Chromatiales bacterium]|nr:hypothetical protein [Chromatiales bacterium]
MHHLNACLRAHALFHARRRLHRHATARSSSSTSSPAAPMPGRRWSDGLHQAVEAKEGVPIQTENQTLASITFQNYFRHVPEAGRHDRHRRHRGLRVPADLRAGSGRDPDHRPMIRKDIGDLVYLHRAGEVRRRSSTTSSDCQQARPAGAGRHDLDRDVRAAVRAAARRSIPHEVLNAKQHEREARDRRAGRPAGRRDHRHQHGRPRHRHRARRQPRQAELQRARADDAERDARARSRADLAAAARAGAGRRRPARHRHRASRIAAHRQPAARPLRPPGRPRLLAASTCRWKTT